MGAPPVSPQVNRSGIFPGPVLAASLALVVLANTPAAGQAADDTPGDDGFAPSVFLEAFRRSRLPGDFAYIFQLEHLPPRGEGRTYHGQLWGSWNEQGPLSRVTLRAAVAENPDTVQILSHNGPEPALWMTHSRRVSEDPAAPPITLVEDSVDPRVFDPILGEIVFTPFDLQMPFLYWSEWTYEGESRTKGRRAHTYRFAAPPRISELRPDIAAVRVAIDAKFNALLRAEILDPDGEPIKTFKILRFKRIDKEWIIRMIDLVDERTGEKTRFTVNAAALNITLPENAFQASDLGKSLAELTWDQFTVID